MGNYTIFKMFENPRRGRQARNIYNKCSENSRSEIVFRTDVFRKLTLGAPDTFLLQMKSESLVTMTRSFLAGRICMNYRMFF